MKVDDIKHGPKKQMDEIYASSVSYHQDMAHKAQSQTNMLWLRYEDLVGQIKYIFIKFVGLLPMNPQPHRRPHRRVCCKEEACHKLANSLARLGQWQHRACSLPSGEPNNPIIATPYVLALEERVQVHY
jgi:hypothetical protein